MMRLLVLSAPSGAGKTTIARRLIQRHPSWRFSVSATTRQQRPNEVHGKDYFFLGREEFQQRIASGELIEWEEIFGNLYGTLRSQIARQLQEAEGDARVIFDVDVKGALSIRAAFPDEALLVFIAPPSLEELERRLRNRQTESAQVQQTRINRARMEMEMQGQFDAVVVNDIVERAVQQIEVLLQ
ncbi:MAG: guanylate kinase [Chlorobi bacterium]|jgi:guanylate kinase|nr:guanylate kinase [Chlorobiota bacterium]